MYVWSYDLMVLYKCAFKLQWLKSKELLVWVNAGENKYADDDVEHGVRKRQLTSFVTNITDKCMTAWWVVAVMFLLIMRQPPVTITHTCMHHFKGHITSGVVVNVCLGSISFLILSFPSLPLSFPSLQPFSSPSHSPNPSPFPYPLLRKWGIWGPPMEKI